MLSSFQMFCLSSPFSWICLHVKFIFAFLWLYLYIYSFPVPLSATVEYAAVNTAQHCGLYNPEMTPSKLHCHRHGCLFWEHPTKFISLCSQDKELPLEHNDRNGNGDTFIKKKKTLLRMMWTNELQKGQCAKAPAIRMMVFPKSLAQHLPHRL